MAEVRWMKAVERPHPPLFIGFLFLGHQARIVRTTIGIDCGFHHLRKESDVLYIDEKEMAGCVQCIEAEIGRKGLDYYQQYAAQCYMRAQTALERCRQAAEGLQNTSQDDLATVVSDFAEEMVSFAPYLLVTISVQATLTQRVDLLFRTLANKSPSDIDEATLRAVLLRPKKKPYVERARDAEREIVAKLREHTGLVERLIYASFNEAKEIINRGEPLVAELIRSYVSEYGWLPLNYFRGTPDTEDRVVERVVARLASEPEAPQVSAPSGYKEEDLRSLLTGNDQKLVDVVGELSFLRSFRLEIFFRCHYLLRSVWPHVAQTLGLSVDQLTYLTHNELLHALRQTADMDPRSLVEGRRAGFDVKISNGDLVWEAPTAARASARGKEGSLSVEGDVAFPGTARAIARVARTPGEASGIGPGHILVTTMTTPAFGTSLARVGGIVTDEGGLLCHAAVISREQKTPCLVGTGRATRTFQSGDLIDLLADHGAGQAKKVDWHKGVRRRSPVLWRYFSTAGHSSPYIRPALDVKSGLDTCKNVDHQTFLASDEYELLREQLTARAREDWSYFDLAAERCYARCEELVRTAEAVAAGVSESPLGLVNQFALYHDATLRTIPFRYGILILDEILTQILEERIRIRSHAHPAELEQILQQLIISASPSFEREYDNAIAEVAKTYQTSKSVFHALESADELINLFAEDRMFGERADEIRRRFEWLRTSYFTGEPLTLRSVAEDIISLMRERTQEAPPRSVGPAQIDEWDQQKGLINKLHLSDAEISLVRVACQYVHLRSFRISVCYKADYIARPLLQKLGSLLNISYGALINLSGTEILCSLKRTRLSIPKTELLAREEGFDLYLANGELWVELAPTYEEITTGSPQDRASEGEQIFGQTVYPGHVTGPARLVLGKDHVGKLVSGDIIISPMTTNDLTMAIRRNCAGIITDEGGTMSHAAIISRENGIPCIVGTGNATERLRDNDLIELDASNGTVRIINHGGES